LDVNRKVSELLVVKRLSFADAVVDGLAKPR